jgi:hypothetical protein
MATKKPNLDAATVRVVKQVLAMPPKHQQDMKLGRPAHKKKRQTKVRASSSKPHTA